MVINEEREMVLDWGSGDVIHRIFERYSEDENDYDMEYKNYEEFWSFAFKITDISGNPPIYVTEDEYFMVSYHNFPKDILLYGTKIN